MKIRVLLLKSRQYNLSYFRKKIPSYRFQSSSLSQMKKKIYWTFYVSSFGIGMIKHFHKKKLKMGMSRFRHRYKSASLMNELV